VRGENNVIRTHKVNQRTIIRNLIVGDMLIDIVWKSLQ
jgi:hypothetical protein